MNRTIFKLYDIRGIYPSEIDEKTVFNIGKSLSDNFFKDGSVVVGHDGRISSIPLYRSLIESLHSSDKKREIIDLGLSTTPMFYFSVTRSASSGGIMITASHNPKNYNGLKVVDDKGEMISGQRILEIIEEDRSLT